MNAVQVEHYEKAILREEEICRQNLLNQPTEFDKVLIRQIQLVLIIIREYAQKLANAEPATLTAEGYAAVIESCAGEQIEVSSTAHTPEYAAEQMRIIDPLIKYRIVEVEVRVKE